MAKKNEQVEERKVFVTIRSSGGRKVELETKQHWPIVAELQLMYVGRPDALDAASWCHKAKPGDKREIVTQKVKQTITLEVHE